MILKLLIAQSKTQQLKQVCIAKYHELTSRNQQIFHLFTHCTKANISDDVGLLEMLSDNINYFKSKPVNIPKITILLDHGYHPNKLIIELKNIYPAIMTKIRFQLSPKPSKSQQKKSGFIPVKARWVIERSNAWMDRCKSLVKNFERTLKHAKAKIDRKFSSTFTQKTFTQLDTKWVLYYGFSSQDNFREGRVSRD